MEARESKQEVALVEMQKRKRRNRVGLLQVDQRRQVEGKLGCCCSGVGECPNPRMEVRENQNGGHCRIPVGRAAGPLDDHESSTD